MNRITFDKGGAVNEVFASNATVHIEAMSATDWWICIDLPGHPRALTGCFSHFGVDEAPASAWAERSE
jgi:hypothetical protein